MRVQPVAFTGSGVVASQLPGTEEQPVGVSFEGFTSVKLHNGSDATGDLVAYCTAPGIFAWNYELYCERGLYVEVAGTGNGTVWLA